MTEDRREKESREIILRLAFPNSRVDHSKRFNHGLDLQEEMDNVLWKEYDARRKTRTGS